MKVELEDILFWMDAIRNSKDRDRTLESFWKGQVRSKAWLVEELEKHISTNKNKVVIHGGWNGVLSSILFNSNIDISHITSLDIDPICEDIARTVNKRQEIEGRFSAITDNMCNYTYDANIVINTSFEHITQSQYEQWLKNVPSKSKIILQSNNYFDCDEHIRCSKNLDDFLLISKITPIWKGVFETPKYDRYMIIGKKDETN